jgi:3-hydroxyisobutyrate dehydrogenase
MLDYNPHVVIPLVKDLRLVIDAADKLNLALPGTALTHQLYQAIEVQGLGNEGNHALVKALEALAAIQVKG